LNFICEIPKGTRKKFEIKPTAIEIDDGKRTKRTVFTNAIVQDTKNGKLREYKWPTKDWYESESTLAQEIRENAHREGKPFPGPQMFWNYGAFPQTWEDPAHETDFTEDGHGKCKGDDDPLDAIEIGSCKMKTGEIRPVKVLGVLAMIDNGETDWKLVVARVDDSAFKGIDTLEDLRNHIAKRKRNDKSTVDVLTEIRHWLKMYKTPGKETKEAKKDAENVFGYKDVWQNEVKALDIVQETHKLWADKTDNGKTNRVLVTKKV